MNKRAGGFRRSVREQVLSHRRRLLLTGTAVGTAVYCNPWKGYGDPPTEPPACRADITAADLWVWPLDASATWISIDGQPLVRVTVTLDDPNRAFGAAPTSPDVTIQDVTTSSTTPPKEYFNCLVTAPGALTFEVTVPITCQTNTSESPRFRITVTAARLAGTGVQVEPL